MFTEATLVTADGTLMALSRPGTGRPVVVLHGVMADAFAWRDVVHDLAPGRPALVPNRRGRRPSAPTGERYSVDKEVEDLVGWLRVLGQPVDVVGHSYGGLIALEAVRRGAAVRSLVLYEPVARPFAEAALPDLVAATARADLDAAVEIINVDVSGYTRRHVDNLREGPYWPKLRELAAPAADELLAIDAFPLDPRAFKALDLSVTLIAGEHSRHRAPYGPCVDMFADALGVDDVMVLPGHDHLAHVTGPAELANAVQPALG